MQMNRGILSVIIPFLLVSGGRILQAFPAASSSDALTETQRDPGFSDLTWEKFQDPFEHAFTIEVPQGWTVKGGLFRVGYSDYRPMLDLRSPDGKTQIRSGDVAIPSYTSPNQYHTREGEINDLGAQAQSVYARYRTGKEFAALYALTHFKTLCQTLTPEETDQTSPVKEPDSGQGSANSKTSAGAISYRCDSGQSSRRAYVYARTTVSPPSLWQVTALVSYIAPADEISLVRGVLMHGSQTFHVDPAWIEYQKKMDADGLQYQIARQRQRQRAIGQQVQEFEARMQTMRNQVSAFERQQNTQARQVESFGNLLTGITPTIDPLNGETRNVWTGPRNGYWINGQGTVVNSETSPGAGFRPLQPGQ
jgi:hypothetical protein